MKEYNPRSIESKWQKYWEDNGVFHAPNSSDKPKYYVLDMFPYPSGSGLHVGHPLGYIASDIYSRYKRQQGFNVLHPMGYDAFGLPAEQYALIKGIHPLEATNTNIKRFREQLQLLGLSFDWSREVKTCDPHYYKWTQQIFLLLFEHYYSTQLEKAQPITALISHFDTHGSQGHDGYSSEFVKFTSEQWNSFSAIEKSNILMNFRLAYRKVSYVNWCEELNTVLANDEVINGLSERGGYPVIQRPMMQWALRITAYVERLLSGLKDVDWSESLKLQQQNWIGKSHGMTLSFPIHNNEKYIEVFTTRPDTIFGVTFMVLAPEHQLVQEITKAEHQAEIKKYIAYASSLSEVERQQDKKVTGAFTGSYAIHPLTQKEIPIFISEYVLQNYGTGAVMAVPSDDSRDNRFAQKYNLSIIDVIDRSKIEHGEIGDKNGILINSNFLNGMHVSEAINAAITYLEKENIGRIKTQYKLRDANFSRQRYWGEPFPILFDETGVPTPVDIDNLPVELPDIEDFKPSEGKSPLDFLEDWKTEINGYTRETDTMPGYAGSSWYFLRFMDPHNPDEMFSQSAIDYWQNVDLYVGGIEHAVGHLMYSRFWHKFLFDLGYVTTEEPFKKLVNQGMIQGISLFLEIQRSGQATRLHIPISAANEHNQLTYTAFQNLLKEDNRFIDIDIEKDIDWQEGKIGRYVQLIPEVEKMSKSKLNVVNPDEIIEEFGADTFRLYEMFLGPIEDSKPWNTQGISGVYKFINRLYSQCYNEDGILALIDSEPSKEELKALHTCIKKVNEDIERLSFNTCVSAFMILLNELRDLNSRNTMIFTEFIKLLAPFAPHICEELWHELGHSDSIIYVSYPKHDEKYLIEDEITYPVCVQGKKRDEITVSKKLKKDELIEISLNLERIQKFTKGVKPKKVIVVPERLINIVL